MIELPLQILDECPKCKSKFGLFYMPFGDEAIEKAKEQKINQIVRAVLYGIKKPRSVIQLNLYWSACGYSAQMLSDHEKILTKSDIDFDLKIRIAKDNPSMIKRFKVVDGITFIEPISIAFKNLKHLTANGFFKDAFGKMAESVGLDVDTFIVQVKSKMIRYRVPNEQDG